MEKLHQEIQQETVVAIVNLATTTTADQTTVETPMATNSRLSKEIIVVDQKLVNIMGGGLRAKSAGGGRVGERELLKTKGPFYFFYCRSGVWHHIRICWRKKPGHKYDRRLHGNFQGLITRTR